MSEHRLVELEHSVIELPERVFHSYAQGQPSFIRCSCGWTARSDEVHIYNAAEEHFGKPVI